MLGFRKLFRAQLKGILSLLVLLGLSQGMVFAEGPSSPANLRIRTAGNQPPLALADSYNSRAGTLLEVPTPGVLANDSDPDGDLLTVQLVSGPSHGALVLNADGSFNYAPADGFTGGDSFSYRANDGTLMSNLATVSLTVNPANSVLITPAWLVARGDGPYLLDQADTTYILQTDVTVDGTAFVVGAANVTLDLNAHTVTYGNAAPITVVNGGFESGSGRNVPGWDVNGATAASLAPNNNYLFGRQVLRLENFSTAQTILSEPIAIPIVNHTYIAHITPGARGHWETALQLSVIDHATGEVLATSSRANAERGILTPVKFTPTTVNPVQIKLVVTPAAGVTTTVELDDAVVALSYDYGIMATREWSGQLRGYNNLSEAAKAGYMRANNFTLTNGRVRQGRARGYGSTPLMFSELLNGLKVNNVEVFVNGLDTSGLVAARVGYTAWEPPGTPVRDIVIADNTFEFDVYNVTDRMYGPSAISVQGDANIYIERNRIVDAPQAGIGGGSSNDQYIFRVNGNDIRHRGVVTNAYAITIHMVSNFEVANNMVFSKNGRGIFVEGWSAIGTQNGSIHGNYVDIQEGFNRENLTSNVARALRMRNNVDAKGPHRNIEIYDNTFIARTGPGLANEAYAARISYENVNGQMDDAGIVIRNNIFRAITNDVNRSAMAFVLDGASQGINIAILENVFESNHISLQILGGDGGDSYDTQFVSNTVRKATEGVYTAYSGIRVGYWMRQAHQISLIDTRYENGASADIMFVGSGAKTLNLGWLLDLKASYILTGSPLSGALVEVFDKDSQQVFSGTTDSQGRVSPIKVVTQVLSKSGAEPLVTDPRGPHRVKVSLAGHQPFEQMVDLQESTVLEVQL